MEIVEVKVRNKEVIEKLVNVWESSVRVTHLFLSDGEIENIKKYVPQALNSIEHLIVVKDEDGNIVAFMGVEAQKLEMLFVASLQRNKGIGTMLMNYAMSNYNLNDLTVNEQNLAARKFYEKFGFKVYKRSDLDEQGGPYPILYMNFEK